MKNEEFSQGPSARGQTCAECGRQFFIPRMDLWAYRFDVKGHTSWFCRYNCLRAGEKKLEAQIAENRSRAGRKQELKSKKPSKEILEKDLRSGLPIAVIAKKYEGSSVQSVHNWIRSYGLAGIQGQKKTVDNVAIEIAKDEKFYDDLKTGYAEMVQESPTLAEIEQFHTDNPVQELPKVEMDVTSMIDEELDRILSTVAVQLVAPPRAPITAEPDPVVEETLDDIWWNVETNMMAAQRKYVEHADKEFRVYLADLILTVTNGRGI